MLAKPSRREVPDKGAWCPTKVPGTRSRVARLQPGPLMDADGALIELTNAAQKLPWLFRLPARQRLPLQKSTFITRQSSIHRSKNSGTVPRYSIEKLGVCPRVFQLSPGISARFRGKK